MSEISLPYYRADRTIITSKVLYILMTVPLFFGPSIIFWTVDPAYSESMDINIIWRFFVSDCIAGLFYVLAQIKPGDNFWEKVKWVMNSFIFGMLTLIPTIVLFGFLRDVIAWIFIGFGIVLEIVFLIKLIKSIPEYHFQVEVQETMPAVHRFANAHEYFFAEELEHIIRASHKKRDMILGIAEQIISYAYDSYTIGKRRRIYINRSLYKQGIDEFYTEYGSVIDESKLESALINSSDRFSQRWLHGSVTHEEIENAFTNDKFNIVHDSSIKLLKLRCNSGFYYNEEQAFNAIKDFLKEHGAGIVSEIAGGAFVNDTYCTERAALVNLVQNILESEDLAKNDIEQASIPSGILYKYIGEDTALIRREIHIT